MILTCQPIAVYRRILTSRPTGGGSHTTHSHLPSTATKLPQCSISERQTQKILHPRVIYGLTHSECVDVD